MPTAPAAEAPPQPDHTDVLGRRVAAALLDGLLLLVLFVVMALLIGESETGDNRASLNLTGWDSVLYFALCLLYFGVMETQARHATLGKRALGIRVESEDGSEPGGGQITGRTLLRIIDWLPFLYLIGFISILATGKRQKRLGDLAAGTRVARTPAG
jgi:uncharacterized RDD family membrane protein YckC